MDGLSELGGDLQVASRQFAVGDVVVAHHRQYILDILVQGLARLLQHLGARRGETAIVGAGPDAAREGEQASTALDLLGVRFDRQLRLGDQVASNPHPMTGQGGRLQLGQFPQPSLDHARQRLLLLVDPPAPTAVAAQIDGVLQLGDLQGQGLDDQGCGRA